MTISGPLFIILLIHKGCEFFKISLFGDVVFMSSLTLTKIASKSIDQSNAIIYIFGQILPSQLSQPEMSAGRHVCGGLNKVVSYRHL
jgi:hypothetical protein